MHEAALHDRNCFITLTYDDEHLPADHSVDVEVWRSFARRLRKKCGQFRYFHCGEYGEEGNTYRPHYHALLFGIDFDFDRVVLKKDGDTTLWTSATLAKLWTFGFHSIGPVTFESAGYVARYSMKKITGDQAEDHYIHVDSDGVANAIKPEYATMSRRPGIGAKWLERYVDDVYNYDVCIVNGRELRPPKYYDRLLEEKDPERFSQVRAKRLQKARERDYSELRAMEKSEAARRSLKRSTR